MIKMLKLEIARLRRMQCGRRSESHDDRVAWLELIVEELETSLATLPADTVSTSLPASRILQAHLSKSTTIGESAFAGAMTALGRRDRRPANEGS